MCEQRVWERWVVAGGALTLGAWTACQRAMQGPTRDSQMILTRFGPLEYGVQPGDPQRLPVLVLHQAMGGFDTALAVAPRFPGRTVIGVSRAGYLRTPLDTGRTPQAMADAAATLLDALGFERVVVAGLSAGGMTALSLALRHPARVERLVLANALTGPLPPYVDRVLAPLALTIRWDCANWLISLGSQAAAGFRAPDAESRRMLRAIVAANPSSQRFPGYENDIRQSREFRPALETLRAPTLVIHSTRDALVPLRAAESAAARIPDARLRVVQGGEHDCFVTHPQVVMSALRDFLA